MPRACATRLARIKAETALAMLRRDEDLRGSYILAADTVVAVGRRILPKAELVDEAAECLRLLSGRNHHVHTAICLVTPKENFRQRHVETRVRFKRLSDEDIEAYLASGEWRGKAGGYAAQGIAGTFIVKLVGSYSMRGRPAALRDPVAPWRRRLSGPLRLAQYDMNPWRDPAARPIFSLCRCAEPQCLPDLRQARRRALRPFCSRRCGDVDLNRWLSGVYAVPGTEDEEEDERRDESGEAGR